MNYLHKLPTGSPEELKVFADNTLDSFFADYNLSEMSSLALAADEAGFFKEACHIKPY